MVQHEVLRLEVREEATQRYRAKQEPEDSEPLVRLVAEVLEAEPEKQPRIARVLPWDSTLWLSAQRKTGKTTILVTMAYALLTGEKFLGEDRKSVVSGRSGSVRDDLGGSRIITKKTK